MENTDKNVLSKIGDGIRNSIMVKLISIGIIALMLLIPASSIESLIFERQLNREAAIEEVSSKWGGQQTISGPVLTVPYKVYYKTKNEELKYSVHRAHFLPRLLNITGAINPEQRKRGIYEVVLYNTKLNASGSFDRPNFSIWNIADEDVLWEEAYISIGIPDMSGIQKNMTLRWNDEKIPIEAGIPDHDVLSSGLSSRTNISSSKSYKFKFDIDLNGSKQLSFIPVGKETLVKLSSSWGNPSFSGKFLPDDRQITDNGFTAEWEVLDVNRNYPQQWQGNAQGIAGSAFGVDLILPVDEYQKNMRSAKYALLVVALSFIIFFLIEILNKKKFHPFQYIMIGLTIVLFYTLLLSISEHFGFNIAYLISSILVVGLITIYVAGVFKTTKLTVLVASLLTVIYFFIFVILQLQDFALLVGSLGLFLTLASLMYLSRNINWYQLSYRSSSETSI
ncbi:Inner membrane protein CreD-like protein [Fulvivirga imtechensis AK7]|uniref:Inner membrane protein CreD-like protein n=1 Tax=Fulvivirga imtechensis AK7 TaxID=1237149 RepID=L8JVJ9_9BACT|nr:cell envelope integrity protein CreD [Fulvivirga imtechensis]ELR72815.1 Inner membrane protein CreD-like protein [Fulvivirga imtechensis AK7]